MSFTVLHKRSDEDGRRPRPDALVDGQIAVNSNDDTPGLFLKTHRANIVRIGPCTVDSLPPNTTNNHQLTKGELWLDISNDANQLNVWDGSQWRVVKS